MPFEIPCARQRTPDGYVFLPGETGGVPCDLRVTFLPLAWYPAESDVGADADYDAEIILIEMKDADGGDDDWRSLHGRDYGAAEAYLETHHHDPMWDAAEADTAEAFGAICYRRAA